MSNINYIVKISTALSNHPFFIKLDREDISVDTIFNEAILELKNNGRPLESQQLQDLYNRHQILNSGQVVKKGDLFKDLKKKKEIVNDLEVQICEIDLVTAHSGG